MTKQEKRNTKLLNGSRRLRIAKGSGTTVQDVNKFMNDFINIYVPYIKMYDRIFQWNVL